MPDGWLCRMALAPYPAYGCDMPGVLVLPDGGNALSGLRVRYAGGLGLCRMAATPYPAYGCGMPGFGFAGWRLRLSRLRVRYVGGVGLPDGGCALSGLRVRYAGGLVLPDGACAYPAYGCDMPGVLVLPDGGCALSGLRVRYAGGFGFAGWRLRLSGLRSRSC